MELNDSLKKIGKLMLDREFIQVTLICNKLLTQSTEPKLEVEHRCMILNELATAHYLLGELDLSMKYFKEILTINPKHTEAAISLSVILNDIGKYDEAKKVYTVAHNTLPHKKLGDDHLIDRKLSMKHLENGDLYMKFHRYDAALDEYGKAFNLDPLNLSIRIKFAKIYSKKGFYSRAIQELQLLCSEHEDYVEARIQLGLLYYSQNNIIDALTEWNKAKELYPNDPSVNQYLVMANQATETIS